MITNPISAVSTNASPLTSKAAATSSSDTPDGQRNRYVDELRTLLKLSAEQVAELNEILDVTRQQYRTFREKHKPEMKAIQDEQVEKIRAILDAGQKATYQQRQQERSRQDRSR